MTLANTGSTTATLSKSGANYNAVCPVPSCKTKIGFKPNSSTQRRSCRKCRSTFNFQAPGVTPENAPNQLDEVSYLVVSLGSGVNVPVTAGDTSAAPGPMDTDGRHMAYEDVVESLKASGLVYLVGPPGSGKSTLLAQIAEDFNKSCYSLSCTEGLSEGRILGYPDPHGDYFTSEAVKCYEGEGTYDGGGMLVFDEVDAMDANTAIVLNEGIANGRMSIPGRQAAPVAVRHEGTWIGAAANTFGTGTQVEFSGRNALDAAFLDRFVGLMIFIDYDLNREKMIAKAGDTMPLLRVLWKIRKNVQDLGMRRCVSTRAIIHLSKLRSTNPEKYTYRELLSRFFAGWTDADREKAMRGIDESKLDEQQDEQQEDEQQDEQKQDDNAVTPICPADATHGAMVKKTARRGRNAGKSFWGCRNYPRCRGTRNEGGA